MTEEQIEKVSEVLSTDITTLNIKEDNYYSRKKLLLQLNKKQKDLVKPIIGSASILVYEHIEQIHIATQWSLNHLESKSAILDKNDNYSGFYDKEKCIGAVSQIPYNKKLKTACWKLGEQIVKVCNNPNSLYGQLYKERKAYELEKNDKLEYKDQAEHILNTINITNKAVIKTNKAGKLTKGHIETRAKRYAVTMLIRHYWEACYYYTYNKKPELPYAIEHLGHSDYIGPEVPYESID